MMTRLAICSILTLLALQTSAQQRIDLDGDTAEWPQGAAVIADSEHIYVRLDLPEITSLQSSSESIHIRFDLDDDAATGERFGDPDGPGFDLEIILSPFAGNTQAQQFTTALITRLGVEASVPVPHASIDLHWSPTHASTQFEVRFDRATTLFHSLHNAGTATMQLVAFNANNEKIWDRDAQSFTMPAFAPHPLESAIPSAPEGSIRVLSWNVRWGSPNFTPEPFDRIFHALQPDILIFQEWDDRNRESPVNTAKELSDWFAESLPQAKPWHAARGNARGTVIVSRFPLERFSPHDVQPDVSGAPNASANRTVRFVGARIATPLGDVLAGSFHLKCCGSPGSSEDQQRLAEAQGIRNLFAQAIGDTPPAGVILAGDMNLVGSAQPLLAMIAGIDTDSSDLAVVDLPVLGDATRATWVGSDTRFPRGRLDYALVSDTTLRVAQSFVLDIRNLSPQALESRGIQPEDWSVSDHLPLIIDLLPIAD